MDMQLGKALVGGSRTAHQHQTGVGAF